MASTIPVDRVCNSDRRMAGSEGSEGKNETTTAILHSTADKEEHTIRHTIKQ